jgi:hypothetical protein
MRNAGIAGQIDPRHGGWGRKSSALPIIDLFIRYSAVLLKIPDRPCPEKAGFRRGSVSENLGGPFLKKLVKRAI